MSTVPPTGVIGGIATIALSIALIWFYLLRKKPMDRGKVRLETRVPRVEESLLSPGPLSPPRITRVSPAKGLPVVFCLTRRRTTRLGLAQERDIPRIEQIRSNDWLRQQFLSKTHGRAVEKRIQWVRRGVSVDGAAYATYLYTARSIE